MVYIKYSAKYIPLLRYKNYSMPFKTLFSFKLKIVCLIGIFFLCSSTAFGADYSSGSFVVKDPVITTGSESASSSNFQLYQSISQTASGQSSSTNFQLWSGFQYYFKASPNTVSATAGNAQVSLSWTIPQTFLGINVSTYEVGVGTSPTSLTYSNVGNVTSFVQTGLTNNTTYYFKIKSKTAAGIVLTYSNVVSATPTGSVVVPQGGGGGGGYSNSVIVSGFAAPSSVVVALQGGNKVGEAQSNSDGSFQVVVNGVSIGEALFAVYFTDPEGTRSDFVHVKVTVSGSGQTSASGILLPPTIRADKIEVKAGDTITFWGYSLPGSVVFLERSGQSAGQDLLGPDGRYEVVFPTTNIQTGVHTMRSKAITGNNSTPFSSKLQFLIGAKNVSTPETGGCPARADFNGDCRVNLVDFSILAYWFKKSPVPAEIDLNQDGVVDLIDFSILAYYWTT